VKRARITDVTRELDGWSLEHVRRGLIGVSGSQVTDKGQHGNGRATVQRGDCFECVFSSFVRRLRGFQRGLNIGVVTAR
jgi:hypothetical protein